MGTSRFVQSTEVRPQFSHLLNFFYEDDTPEPGVPNGLYRVLEFVDVPSAFAGTRQWLNPQQFGSGVTPVGSSLDARFNRQPPFNVVPEFREPGRVNINTLLSEAVWQGLFHGDPQRNSSGSTHPGPDFDDDLGAQRRGFDISGGSRVDLLALKSGSPTMFANAFRSAGAAALTPLPDMVRAPVDATVYRSLDGSAGASPTPGGDPMFSAETDEPYADSRRNGSYFHGPLVRIDNLTTTRSSVYAVWITIGFFEVDEITNDVNDQTSQAVLSMFGGDLASARQNPLFARVYPEGVTLGQEAGADTGEVRRLRGFYILDRSIPAGFDPGKDANVENIVRLRRQID